jgi:hypothetical protein
MGDKVVQYFGLSRGLMQKFQELMGGELINAQSLMESKIEISQLAVSVMVGYAPSSRCEEIPKLDIAGLRKHFADGEKTALKHVMLWLVGWFKQEDGERQHVLHVAAVTGSC